MGPDTPDATQGLVTRLLHAVERGEAKAADELLPIVYDELRRLAGSRIAALAPGQTLQATALVHETYIRLVGDEDPGWDGRAHFFGAAARAMREILVEQARRKASLARGGHLRVVGLTSAEGEADPAPDIDVLTLDEALTRLREASPRKAELVMLRFFGGLTAPEVAEVLGISTATVQRDWRFAKAWLQNELRGPFDDEQETRD